MKLLQRSTLPNVITVGRVVLAPAVSLFVLMPGVGARFLAFFLFVVAGVSDLWDGYLARKHGWITDFGKLMDPLADKLLLVATFVPFYILSHGSDPVGRLPYWDVLPLWVLLLVFGREVLVTVIRAVAARRGVVIAAGKVGKHKAFSQNFFIGSTLLWYALQTAARAYAWSGTVWTAWQAFHGAVLALALLVAVVLTVYSLAVYLHSWWAQMRSATR